MIAVKDTPNGFEAEFVYEKSIVSVSVEEDKEPGWDTGKNIVINVNGEMVSIPFTTEDDFETFITMLRKTYAKMQGGEK